MVNDIDFTRTGGHFPLAHSLLGQVQVMFTNVQVHKVYLVTDEKNEDTVLVYQVTVPHASEKDLHAFLRLLKHPSITMLLSSAQAELPMGDDHAKPNDAPLP